MDTLRNIKPEDNIKHNTISKVLGGLLQRALLFDFANKWAECIGQSLYYGQVTKRQPACVLIMERGEKDLRYLRRLRKAAYKKGIRTFTMRPEHLINKTKTAAGK